MFTVFQWFFNRKTLIKILPSIGRFYANETPRTDDFYRHKTLDFSRRAVAATGKIVIINARFCIQNSPFNMSRSK